MPTIAEISRLAHVIADIPLASRMRMPYAVTTPLLGPQTFLRATTIGMAIGYDVVRVETARTMRAAEHIATHAPDTVTGGGRTLILVDARGFDGNDRRQRDVLADAVDAASAGWAASGGVALLVVTEDTAEVARLVGSLLDDPQWAKNIA